jgi:hypothetical protein
MMLLGAKPNERRPDRENVQGYWVSGLDMV